MLSGSLANCEDVLLRLRKHSESASCRHRELVGCVHCLLSRTRVAGSAASVCVFVCLCWLGSQSGLLCVCFLQQRSSVEALVRDAVARSLEGSGAADLIHREEWTHFSATGLRRPRSIGDPRQLVFLYDVIEALGRACGVSVSALTSARSDGVAEDATSRLVRLVLGCVLLLVDGSSALLSLCLTWWKMYCRAS